MRTRILYLFRREMRVRFARIPLVGITWANLLFLLEKRGKILYTIGAYTCTPEP
jgi:hypothetical protein